MSDIKCGRCGRSWKEQAVELHCGGCNEPWERTADPQDLGWAKLGPLADTPGYVCTVCLTSEERAAESLGAVLRASGLCPACAAEDALP
jgi:hypothetical protein